METMTFDHLALFTIVEDQGWSDFKVGGLAVGWILGTGKGQEFIEFLKTEIIKED